MMCKFYLIKLLKKIVSFSFCICVTHTLDYLTTFVYCLNYFFKYSFNANTTHNCICKMNIIALFLHILWDRKCSYWFPFQKRRQWFVFAFKWPQIQASLRLSLKGTCGRPGGCRLAPTTHTPPAAHMARTLGDPGHPPLYTLVQDPTPLN